MLEITGRILMKKPTLEERIAKAEKQIHKMEIWLARHIKRSELPLAINLNLHPEAMYIINERLKHG